MTQLFIILSSFGDKLDFVKKVTKAPELRYSQSIIYIDWIPGHFDRRPNKGMAKLRNGWTEEKLSMEYKPEVRIFQFLLFSS